MAARGGVRHRLVRGHSSVEVGGGIGFDVLVAHHAVGELPAEPSSISTLGTSAACSSPSTRHPCTLELEAGPEATAVFLGSRVISVKVFRFAGPPLPLAFTAYSIAPRETVLREDAWGGSIEREGSGRCCTPSPPR